AATIRCSVSAVCACRNVAPSPTGLTSAVIHCSITAMSKMHCTGGDMSTMDAPVLAGIHHLKLPVTDLARSLEWYRSRLGYEVRVEFVEQGTLMGCGLGHPAGGPDLGLRLDPDRARAAAGFDYFAIGVPDKAAIDRLARRLDELGQAHAGVHRASLGWILP